MVVVVVSVRRHRCGEEAVSVRRHSGVSDVNIFSFTVDDMRERALGPGSWIKKYKLIEH